MRDTFRDAQSAPPPESWTSTLVRFEHVAQSYESSKKATHPFTAAEIAQAGTVASVELNADFQVKSLSLLANDVPNRVPSSALEASLRQSNMRIAGLYSGNSGDGSFGGNPQIREVVLQNATQSGSAGIDQLSLNDCPFEAAVACLAATDAGQEAIAQMITQNKDGSYNVKFPGAKESVKVTQKDLQNPELGNSAMWANILEAASYKIDPATAENGGRSEQVLNYMSLLTGREANGIDLTKRKESVVEAGLRKLLASGAVIEGGAAVPGAPLEKEHAYSVLSMSGDTLIIRNPWGNNSRNDGFEPKVGQTEKGVTNLGGGELSMSVQTYIADLPALFISEQK